MESIIKILREKNRYTQVHLAELLGISRQALIKYENLEQEPPVSTIRTLSKLFGVEYE
jgi:transcriptional regulator with XRE-family HTH domain